MWWARLRIPEGPVRIAVRREPLRLTYPRVGRLIAGGLALPAGLALWLWQLPANPWAEPVQYAWGLLLIGPGLALALAGLAPRPLLETAGGDLLVRYGPPGLERLLTRFPLDTLEVAVERRTITTVRLDGLGLFEDFGAAILPIRRRKNQERAVPQYLLQLRSRGQMEWLAVLGSEVSSEVENARLALAVLLPPQEVEPVPDACGEAAPSASPSSQEEDKTGTA